MKVNELRRLVRWCKIQRPSADGVGCSKRGDVQAKIEAAVAGAGRNESDLCVSEHP